MDRNLLGNDNSYFTQRAQEERERAAISTDNTAKLAHLKMAEAYDKRVSDRLRAPA